MLLYVPKGRITVAMIFEQMSKDKFNEVCCSNFFEIVALGIMKIACVILVHTRNKMYDILKSA